MAKVSQKWTARSSFTAAAMAMAILFAIHAKIGFAKYQTPNPEAVLVIGSGQKSKTISAK